MSCAQANKSISKCGGGALHGRSAAVAPYLPFAIPVGIDAVGWKATVSLEGPAVLLDEGVQRHGRAAADRLDRVVGPGEDAGLVVERHLADVL